MALRYLAGERSNVSLQATALVNEVCLRLLGWDQARWQNREHFFGVSAQMMRRVLVDIARRRRADRRGGAGAVRVPLDGIDVPAPRARRRSGRDRSRRSRSWRPRILARPASSSCVSSAGLSMEETAQALGVSLRTVHKRLGVRARLAVPGADRRWR